MIKKILAFIFKRNKCGICQRRSRKKLCPICDKATSNMANEIRDEEDKRIIEEMLNHIKMQNPDKIGEYLCRLRNGFICMAYFDGIKWVEMWGNKELDVVKYIDIPEEIKDVEIKSKFSFTAQELEPMQDPTQE